MFVCSFRLISVCNQFSRGVFSMLGAVSPESFDTLHSYSNTFQMPFVTPWFPEKVSHVSYNQHNQVKIPQLFYTICWCQRWQWWQWWQRWLAIHFVEVLFWHHVITLSNNTIHHPWKSGWNTQVFDAPSSIYVPKCK